MLDHLNNETNNQPRFLYCIPYVCIIKWRMRLSSQLTGRYFWLYKHSVSLARSSWRPNALSLNIQNSMISWVLFFCWGCFCFALSCWRFYEYWFGSVSLLSRVLMALPPLRWFLASHCCSCSVAESASLFGPASRGAWCEAPGERLYCFC